MEKPTIGLVMKSLQAEFFQEMKKGALEYAAQNQDINLITVGTNSQTEIELQIELIEKFIQNKVDAIVVIPIDSKALVPVVVKAIKAGIKVINIDIKLDEELLAESGVELTYVGPDNKTASATVGKVLAQKLEKGAKVILIEGLAVAENAQQRKSGFLEAIAAAELDLVASVAANWETGTAETVFASLFEQHPDVQGVFCSNDAMALGVLKVLAENQRAGIVPVVGFDNDASVLPHLESGAMLATIDAFGSQMAVQGIEYALKVLNGMENKGAYTTPFELISGENLQK